MNDSDMSVHRERARQRFLAKEDFELLKYIKDRTCGKCYFWLKSSLCPRERPGTGKRSGYSIGPSSHESPCQEFKPDFDYEIALEIQTIKKLGL